MRGTILDSNIVIDELEKILISDGKMIPADYSAIKDFSQEQISSFCHKYAIYQIITTELLNFTKEQIGDRKAIEIACGNGCYGRALQIPITDNRMQEWESISRYYQMLNTPTIKYREDTINLEANVAIEVFKPEVVIASWATQIYNPALGDNQASNVFGIDEKDILSKVQKYIHVGNQKTHGTKEILSIYEHDTYHFEWLVSRSMSRGQNVIYIFKPNKIS
jgi:hypothetical protein